jgi:hypothetical protein
MNERLDAMLKVAVTAEIYILELQRQILFFEDNQFSLVGSWERTYLYNTPQHHNREPHEEHWWRRRFMNRDL